MPIEEPFEASSYGNQLGSGLRSPSIIMPPKHLRSVSCRSTESEKDVRKFFCRQEITGLVRALAGGTEDSDSKAA